MIARMLVCASLVLPHYVFAIERLELPSVHGYHSGDPLALYERQFHLQPRDTIEALEAMAERGTTDVREEALVLLARSEAFGELYAPNYPAAMRLLRQAARRYHTREDKLAFARSAFDVFEDNARSALDRQTIRYLELAFERETARGVAGLSLAKVVSAATTKLKSKVSEKPDPSAFSRQALESRDTETLDTEEKILRDIWRLADENFPQAQYEIGIYLFRAAGQSSDPQAMRSAAVKRLWAAAGSGHRPAAETLVDYWLSHKTVMHRQYACSLVLAFRDVIQEEKNRRMLFSRPVPDCGRPGKERLHNPEVTQQLVAILRESPLYLAEGNIHGAGELIWTL